MLELVVEKKDAGQRLDKYVGRVLKKAPLSFIYRSLRQKDIRKNGKKAEGSEILKEGDVVLFRFPDVQIRDLGGGAPAAADGGAKAGTGKENTQELQKAGSILYEDADILLFNKKAGILSQRSAAGEQSLNEILLRYCGGGDGMYTPSVCNRIDRNTTGIVAFAKTYRGARLLGDAFRSRSSRKIYLAGVIGNVRQAFREKAHLQKDAFTNRVTIGEEGEEIETAWEPAAHSVIGGQPVTLLKVELITGKTHQIRAHLAARGIPVIGDPKYGGSTPGYPHQLLHAYELSLPDGRTFRAPVPGQLCRLFQDFQEIGVTGGTDMP